VLLISVVSHRSIRKFCPPLAPDYISEARMSLSDFIEANLDGLVDDWTTFAAELKSSRQLLAANELQDSARLLLQVAADMRIVQSDDQQHAKSRGEKGGGSLEVKAVAQGHANERLDQGFSLNDVVAEFRALRAAVLRRWRQTSLDPSTMLDEMGRFNEAIDQTLTESVRQYSLRVSQTRDRFTGILAHDLRSPLGAISNATEFLLLDESLSPSCIRAVANIQRSATRMRRMIDDLLDFARTRLGDTLPITVSPQNAQKLCRNACDEVSASYPQAGINMRFEGDLTGDWDGDRVSQLVVNLLVNAIQHGEGEILLFAQEEGDRVKLIVSNKGKPIPKPVLANIFDPLTRTYSSPQRRGMAAGAGLGLYICKGIAQAHGGNIAVDAANTVTSFTVSLPRSEKK
jgi:signal transduction histidine kinase